MMPLLLLLFFYPHVTELVLGLFKSHVMFNYSSRLTQKPECKGKPHISDKYIYLEAHKVIINKKKITLNTLSVTTEVIWILKNNSLKWQVYGIFI